MIGQTFTLNGSPKLVLFGVVASPASIASAESPLRADSDQPVSYPQASK